jgi:hypothetical protein
MLFESRSLVAVAAHLKEYYRRIFLKDRRFCCAPQMILDAVGDKSARKVQVGKDETQPGAQRGRRADKRIGRSGK